MLHRAITNVEPFPGVSHRTNLAAVVDDLRSQLDDLAQQVAKPAHSVSARFVRSILEARRRRNKFFDSELFADPGWDILLELYAMELAQERVSVSKLCLAAGVPASTALRWITKMEKDGLLKRREDPLDGRRVWIALSDEASDAMERYFGGSPVLPVV